MSRTSGTPVKVERVERCSPLPVETMIPALLVVLALMWPDLTSVELFGLGRIQRRLHDQDIRQTQLEAVQQRLESRIENTLAVQQNPTINFGTSSAAALIAESKVDDDGRRLAEAGGEHGSSSVDQSEALMASVEPIKPWINLARRMNDPGFAAVVDAGAASGSPSDAPGLMRSDVALLRKVERPGHPFDVTALRAWASENSLQLDAVRDTLSAGAQANPESIRVATKFANQLFSDLQRRGLVATA
jgi:hypothetical protein